MIGTEQTLHLDVSAHQQTSWRDIATRIFVLGSFVVCFVTAWIYVDQFGSPIPYADEWENTDYAVGKVPVTAEWLWSPHNEHRIPIPRLLYLLISRFSGNNSRVVMFSNLILLGCVTLSFLFFVHRIRGSFSWTDVFFPLCLLSIGQYENLIWAFQIAFVLCVVLLSIVLLLLSTSNKDSGFGRLFAIGICLNLLPLCGATGLVPQPLLVLWLSAAVMTQFRAGKLTKSQVLLLFIQVLIALTISILYFVGIRPNPNLLSFDPVNVAHAFVECLSTAFGPLLSTYTSVCGAMVAISILAAVYILVRTWKEQAERRMVIAGLFLFLMTLLVLTLSIAIGRGGGGAGFGAAGRYVPLTACMLSGVYVVCATNRNRRIARILPVTLVLVLIFVFPHNARSAVQYGKNHRLQYLRLVRDVYDRLPIEALATRDVGALCPFYTPALLQWTQVLQDYKLGPFAESGNPLPGVADFLEIEIPLPESSQQKPLYRLDFPRPKMVLGVQPTFIIGNGQGKPAQFDVSWKDSTGDVRGFRFPLISLPQEQTYTFWIYDPMERLEFSSPGDLLRLTKMKLLVKR